MALDAERQASHRAGQSLRDLRAPLLWGALVGVAQLASPFALWWLTPATVYALGLAFIAAIYIGFSVSDGRAQVIAVECAVAAAFVIVAAIGVTGSEWLLVAGLAGHGVKDWWQHRTNYVANMRWWPPFCASVDFVVATLSAVVILAGADLHG